VLSAALAFIVVAALSLTGCGSSHSSLPTLPPFPTTPTTHTVNGDAGQACEALAGFAVLWENAARSHDSQLRRVVEREKKSVAAWARALDVARWNIAPTADALVSALRSHDDQAAARLLAKLDYCNVMLVP
jgi:hypothetical protein